MNKKAIAIMLAVSILLNFFFLYLWVNQVAISDEYCQMAHQLRDFGNMAIEDMNSLLDNKNISSKKLDKFPELGDCPITKYSEVEK